MMMGIETEQRGGDASGQGGGSDGRMTTELWHHPFETGCFHLTLLRLSTGQEWQTVMNGCSMHVAWAPVRSSTA